MTDRTDGTEIDGLNSVTRSRPRLHRFTIRRVSISAIMSRTSLLRVYQVAAIGVAVAVLVLDLASATVTYAAALLFFSALVMAASFFRLRQGEESFGWEGAVSFAAVMLYHTPGAALVPVFVGTALHHVWLSAARRRFRIADFYRAAQSAISYWLVALLYTSAVARGAPVVAKISGYILLVVGYLVADLLLTSIRHTIEGAPAPDFRRYLVGQGKVLVIVSPIVAAEVLGYGAYGIGGFAVAFFPLLMIAWGTRSAAAAERRNAELVRRNRELSILTENSTRILSAESDHETLKRLTALLTSLSRVKACAVVTWEPNPEESGTVYRYGECLRNDQDILGWVEQAGFAQSAPSRAFVFQNDFRKFPLSSGQAIQVIIGIQTPEVIYGVLILETEDLSILKSESMNLLTLLVNQTALSLQDQLLRREMREKTIQLEQRAATTSTILEVATGLIGSFEDVDQALTRIALAVRKALGFQVVVFLIYEPKNDVFLRRAHAGLDDVWDEVRKKPVSSTEIMSFFNQEFRVSNSFFVSHLNLRQSDGDFFVRPDEDESPFLVDDWHANDMLFVPLMSADQLIGYLSVRDPQDGKVPSIDKVQTLEIFAAQAVTALQSARQYEEIKRLTFIDALTPAFNHRYFQEALSKEIHRHARTQHEFTLAMLDIDNFKRINDTFGHPVGDEILRGLVEELMTNARDIDIVSRYGGEEFALIFPETAMAAGHDAAERLRALIERREFRLPQLAGRPLRVTISVGLSVYPHDGLNSADLIARADAALYYAKKNGKNRVCIAGGLNDAPTISLTERRIAYE
jgi:diguanylate cyclase (GGDEF)-like protein